MERHYKHIISRKLAAVYIGCLVFITTILAGCQNRPVSNETAMPEGRLGPNLIYNGGFEEGEGTTADGWQVWGGYALWDSERNIRTNTTAHSGSYSVQVGGVYCTGEWPFIRWYPSSRIPVQAGPYVLKFWVKSVPGSNFQDATRLWFAITNYSAPTGGSQLQMTDQRMTLAEPDASGWAEMSMVETFLEDGYADVRIGTPFIQGDMYFDDVSFHKLDPQERVANMNRVDTPEITTLSSPLLGIADGTFHTQKINGSWWLVHPDGEAHFLNGLGFRRWGSYDPVAWSWVEANYSSYPTGTADGYQRYFGMPHINEWGFTGLGSLETYAETIMDLYEQDNPSRRPMHWGAIFSVDWSEHEDYTPYHLRNRDGEYTPQTRGKSDPYNLSWRAAIDDRAYVWFNTEDRKNNTDHFAYLSVGGETYTHKIQHYLYSDACMAEFISWLEEKYNGDVESLKNAWNSSFQTFNSYTAISDVGLDIGVNPEARPEAKQWMDPVYDDLNEFTRKLISDHNAISIEKLRKYDNNKQRPICSDWILPEFRYAYRYLDLMSDYDMVAMSYVDCAESWFGAERGAIVTLQEYSDVTGRPALCPEWNIRAVDADKEGVDSAWPYRQFIEKGEGVDTQAQRGESYALAVKQMAAMPGIIGQTYFHWFDCTVSGTGDVGNQGWVDGNSQPYQDFVDRASEVNHKLFMLDPACRSYKATTQPEGRLVSSMQCTLCTDQNAGYFLAGMVGMLFVLKKRTQA